MILPLFDNRIICSVDCIICRILSCLWYSSCERLLFTDDDEDDDEDFEDEDDDEWED